MDLKSLQQYDLFCHGRLGADRYPVYHQLRSEEPAHWSEPMKSWVLTRYDDVYSGFLDPRLSAQRVPIFLRLVPEPIRAKVQPLEEHFKKWLGMVDPPDHTRLRKLILLAFTPKVVEGIRSRIQNIVNDRLDQLEAQGQMDLVNDFAFPLPATVISDLLGVPTEDLSQFKRRSDDLMMFLGGAAPTIGGTVEQSQKSLLELKAYFNGLIDERRRHPRDDLISSMIAAQEEGDRLNDEELVAMCIFLFFAGHETTMSLISNGFLALLQHRAELEKLRDNASLTSSAIEEFLRFYSPLQRQIRVALEDLEIRGKQISKGQAVLLMQGAANRDPEQFPDPDRLDICRNPNKHLAFGLGIHFCLGAPLGRLESQIAFDTILHRFPDIQLMGRPEDLQWQPSMTFLSLKSLPVRF